MFGSHIATSASASGDSGGDPDDPSENDVRMRTATVSCNAGQRRPLSGGDGCRLAALP